MAYFISTSRHTLPNMIAHSTANIIHYFTLKKIPEKAGIK